MKRYLYHIYDVVIIMQRYLYHTYDINLLIIIVIITKRYL